MRDRFDSVYRTNKLDPIDHVHEGEKKRKIKASFKFKMRSNVYGTVAEKLDKKNKRKQIELDARSKQGFLKDDLIMLWIDEWLKQASTELLDAEV